MDSGSPVTSEQPVQEIRFETNEPSSDTLFSNRTDLAADKDALEPYTGRDFASPGYLMGTAEGLCIAYSGR